MCESQTLHFLCGHIGLKIIIQCAKMTEKLVQRGKKEESSLQVCDDFSDDPHLFPDICEKCKTSSNLVISDFLQKAPGAKFDAVRLWKQQFRPKNDTKASKTSNEPQSNDEELEYIEPPTMTSDQPTDPSDSPSGTSLNSNPSPQRSESGLTDIKSRLGWLRDKTEQLLDKVRAAKTVRTRPTSSSAE